MNILFISAENYHSTYPEQYLPIYKNILKNEYFVNFKWIFRTSKFNKVTQEDDDLILIPKDFDGNGIIKTYIIYFNNIRNAVKSFYKSYRIDIIHSFDDPVMGLVAYIFSKKNSTPYIYQVTHLKEEETIIYAKERINGSYFVNFIKGFIGLKLRNWLLIRANLVFAVSDEMKVYFSGIGVDSSKIIVIPAAINFNINKSKLQQDLIFLKSKYQLNDSKVIFYMGTLNKFRKLDILLDILIMISLNHPKIKLVVVGGTDAERSWFNMKIQEKKLEQYVIVVGIVPRNELYAHILLGDICLAPYEKNAVNVCNSPVKLLEYMMMGATIVGTNLPSQKPLLEFYNNGHAVNHSVEDFAMSIDILLKSDKKLESNSFKSYLYKTRSFESIAKLVFNSYEYILK